MGRYDIDEREMLEAMTKTLTYDELKLEVEEEFEIEKNSKLQRDPTEPSFLVFVLSSMKEGQSVEINEYTCEYKISE